MPFSALNKYGVQWSAIPAIPGNPYGSPFQELYEYISQYDFVVVQRNPKYEQVKLIRDVCDLLGKKLVYETDDDYLHIPPENPAWKEFSSPEFIAQYKLLLGLADLVTVSTQELKETYYPFNKNIHVLPNNMEYIFAGENLSPKRDHIKEEWDEKGRVQIINRHGLMAVPSWWEEKVKDPMTGNVSGIKKHRTVRIGYTATPSHRADFDTIYRELDKVVAKYEGKIWLVFIGDSYFTTKLSNGRKRTVGQPLGEDSYLTHINTTYNMDQYYHHIRNIDIGLAPLTPNIFNMSKSPIKAIEYGSWGIPAILPNYITYTREFTDHKNCLLYNNAKEFGEALEVLINNHELREELGTGARDLVRDRRLERDHTDFRYKIYKDLIDNNPNYLRFIPDKKEEVINV